MAALAMAARARLAQQLAPSWVRSPALWAGHGPSLSRARAHRSLHTTVGSRLGGSSPGLGAVGRWGTAAGRLGAALHPANRRFLSDGAPGTGGEAEPGSVAEGKDQLPTGGLRQLMHIPPVEEMLGRAKKAAAKIKLDETLRSPKERSRKLANQRIHEFSKTLTKPLGEIIDTYSNFQHRLHPFEQVVAQLVIVSRERNGEGTMVDLLKEVKLLRKLTSQYANEGSHAAMKSLSIKEADDIRSSTQQRIFQMWEDREPCMKRLQKFVKDLRSVPVLDERMPSAVLVGCPNVGKSSIVRLISSGLPEVANYPFTTRGMSMGHMSHDAYGAICQIMDTPGLLARDASAHNVLEQLTLAAIEHTKAVVLFVLDPTGTAGPKSSVKNQLLVRAFLREKFPDARWIDVLSKSDMPFDKGEYDLPQDAIPVSCTVGTGKEELTEKVLHAIHSELFQMRNQKL